jgi:DNA-directed RNA polymerase specialized sigma24 family protein
VSEMDGAAEFAAYVRRDGGRLTGLAYLLTGDRHEAEDLVQSALLKMASRWPAARANPDGYARTVVVNLVRDRWRGRGRGGGRGWRAGGGFGEVLVEDVGLVRGNAGTGGLVTYDDGLALRDERDLLVRACLELPAQQRAVLVLRFWEDRSVAETAALLGCGTGTVKSHTHRALAHLRTLLGPDPAAAAASCASADPAREGTSC